MKHKQIPLLARHHARPPHNVYDLDSASAAFDSIKQAWGPNLIDRVEAQMSAMMKSACLPTAAGFKFSPKPNSLDSGLDKFVISKGYAIGSEIFYAASILEEIGEIRHAIAVGKLDHVLHYAIQFGVLSREANIQVGYGDILKTGECFEGGRKKPRRDQLARLIERAFSLLGGDATPDAILRAIDGMPGLQEIDQGDKTIYWRNDRGVEKKSSYKAFQNRVAQRRKLFHNSGKG